MMLRRRRRRAPDPSPPVEAPGPEPTGGTLEDLVRFRIARQLRTGDSFGPAARTVFMANGRVTRQRVSGDWGPDPEPGAMPRRIGRWVYR